ncbi:NUDIX domain-containing protein [Marinomonas balearica]|uniref:NUDIX domain-containing protein n=1 Tax=Marinomonas balearica TaxID=491947 RepID=A0A4R6MD91_9GAMM|nr:NUDIX domain-containing protein [Marinomonas balearica]TDO99484.1 NUDIX domain-containing protein [Marinomonas balearica]
MVKEIQDGITVLNQPAGHVENNESIVSAVIRETYEESGWRVKPKGILGFYTLTPFHGADTYHRICIVCDALEQVSFELDPDIIESVWLSETEINAHALRSPLVKKCIDDLTSYAKSKRSLIPLDAICNDYL